MESDPAATVNPAVTAHRATNPTASPAMAWTVAWRRVVRPANSSSHRPASSSPRSRRVAVSRPQIAPTMISRPNIRHATKPSIVPSWRAGPVTAARLPLLPNVLANSSREARVGKFVW